MSDRAWASGILAECNAGRGIYYSVYDADDSSENKELLSHNVNLKKKITVLSLLIWWIFLRLFSRT